jgi:glutaredoxin
MPKSYIKKNYLPFIITAAVIFSLLLIWVLFLKIYEPKTNTENPLNTTDTMILFYGYTCSHCKAVEEYITENNLESKLNSKDLKIIRKEIYKDVDNRLEFENIAKFCKLSDSQKGVPFLFYNQECYIGDTDVLVLLDDLAAD